MRRRLPFSAYVGVVCFSVSGLLCAGGAVLGVYRDPTLHRRGVILAVAIPVLLLLCAAFAWWMKRSTDKAIARGKKFE